LDGRRGTFFYQSTEQPLWREDHIYKEDPTKDATEPVKTHYSSAKVKAFLEKAGQSAIKLKNLPLCFLNFRIEIRIKVDGCGVVTIAHAFI
jgi:hypothetical protein